MHCTDFTDMQKENESKKLGDRASLRILHVVGGMDRAGTETWLMHVLRHIDRDRFQMDFLVHTDEPCPYDEEVRALGSEIIPCLSPSKPWLYANNFKRILREYGPYDMVHSHVHHFSGYVLWLAKQAGIPVRIAHSHNDTSSIDAKAGFYRCLYLTLTKWLIDQSATFGLASSRQAATVLLNKSWKTDPRWQILYCGVDLEPFHNCIDTVTTRAELGIPADAFVVGHIGRFEEQKNHKFLIDIAAEVARREPKMYLLLIGDGTLRSEIKQKVIQMGLGDRVIFTGCRSDVPRLLGAMDLFVFPSLYEGLGLVLIEAQAAGKPCIFSDVVPEEADIIPSLVHRISLAKPQSVWAEAVITHLQNPVSISQMEALAFVEGSLFNIQRSSQKLQKYYLML